MEYYFNYTPTSLSIFCINMIQYLLFKLIFSIVYSTIQLRKELIY